jgi:hypothetical protein
MADPKPGQTVTSWLLTYFGVSSVQALANLDSFRHTIVAARLVAIASRDPPGRVLLRLCDALNIEDFILQSTSTIGCILHGGSSISAVRCCPRVETGCKTCLSVMRLPGCCQLSGGRAHRFRCASRSQACTLCHRTTWVLLSAT